MAEMLPIYESCDVVVVGNGSAGCVSALAAARNGARTVLVSQHGFLGGVMGSGLPLDGFFDMYLQQIVRGIADEIVQRLAQHPHGTSGHAVGDPWLNSRTSINPLILRCLLAEMMVAAGVQVLFNAVCVGVARNNDGAPTGVIVEAKGGRQPIPAQVIVDSSGDGDVSVFAGAEFIIGRAADGVKQAATLVFTLDGVEREKLKAYLRAHPDQMRSPLEVLEWPSFNVVGLWDLVAQATRAGEFPAGHSRVLIGSTAVPTQMTVNTTRVENPDALTAKGLSDAELRTQMQVVPLWVFFRKYVPGFERCYISHIAHTVGIRESRHIVGEYTLTEDDVQSGRLFPDVIGRGGYNIDLHNPTKGEKFPGRHSKTQPYDIPYRILVPKGVDNMLMAGRQVSATHEAAGSLRVMAQTMAMGQAAGTAAALAVHAGVQPRTVDIKRLQQTLLAQGAELGPQFGGPGIPEDRRKPVGETWDLTGQPQSR